MISNSKYGNAKKQELNFLEILEKWTSKVDKCPQENTSGLTKNVCIEEINKKLKLKFPDGKDRIPCDTLYNCKRDVMLHLEKPKNTLNNFQCAICRDHLYTETFNLYGQDEKTEKSPFGRNNAVRRQVISRSDYKYGYVLNRDTREMPKQPDCPGDIKIQDDSFDVPCCQPVKVDGIVKIIDPKSPADLATMSPFLADNPDLPCCGGGPSCCRWCPETLCDSLEKASESLPKLWWHVCSGEDTNPSFDGYGKHSLGSTNGGKTPGSVKKT
jgi:hypothetical protein